jgi:integrase/recombinase XerC/integrase/recombinase XerD
MKSVADAVQSYIFARTADGRASSTIRDYHRTLTDELVEWSEKQGLKLDSMVRDDVRRYVAYLRESDWSVATVGIYVRNLRAFLRWCYEEGYTETNLALAVKPPKMVKRREKLLTPEELQRLIDVCQGYPTAFRDKAIILTFLDSGLRRGEMVRLQLKDIHIEGETTWIGVYASKTDTTRFAFLREDATRALKDYLATRTDDYQALWIGKQGPLKANSINHILRRRAKDADLDPNRVHPHVFRKLFATQWVEGGGDPTRLMWLGGWTSMQMLDVYVQLSRKRDLAAAHQQYSPVDRMLNQVG